MGYGAREAPRARDVVFFVVTAEPPDSVRLDVDVRFVPTVREAVTRARPAAGDKDVFVMGGGQTVGSCLAAGLLAELRIHLSPEVLGAGTPLFTGVGRHRLEQRSVTVSGAAIHLTYGVRTA
jgi:dihydrofolate reductase